MSNARSFPTIDVIGAVTGRLLGDIGGIYEVRSFLTGKNLMTHQLPRAGRAIQKAMLKRDPEFWSEVVDFAAQVNPENLSTKLEDIDRKWGATMVLSPLPPSEYRAQDPIAELEEMTGNKVVFVHVGPKDQ
jgi:hypothetical protein